MSYIEIFYSPSSNIIIQQKIDYTEKLTIEGAIKKSGILDKHPEVKELSVGIFSNKVSLEYVVKPKDRIEIYRPLLACPKEKRRKRAKNCE